MQSGHKLGAAALALAVLLSSGCKRGRKPQLPPHGQAPTIVSPAPTEEIPEVTDATIPPVVQPPVIPPPKKKPRRHAKPQPAPVAPTPSQPGANTKPPTQVVPNAGAPDSNVQISTGNSDAASRQRQTTAQLIDSTENTLRNINRQLNDSEQAVVQQIRTYIAQSKTASNEGDLERALNLATKAHLLSDELAKR